MIRRRPAAGGSKNLKSNRSPLATELTELTERQATVLRALVATYVEQAGPVSSGALSERMPTSLSPASIRNTLAELHEAGLIDKAHASAGRVPTPLGMSVFIDRLLDLADLGPKQQRMLDRALDGVDAAETPRHTSHLLSEHTRQLGFVMAPRVEHLRMRSVHLVAVAEQRVLAVLVAENGGVIQRVFDYPERLTARELDRAATLLATRLAGRTLVGLRRVLEEERERLRGEADQWMRRVWALGLQTCEQDAEDDLVIATRIALLDQPEFSDPERIRGLFAALETNQKLLGLLRELAKADSREARLGFRVNLGQALDEPSLQDCALVAMPYGHLPRPNRDRFIGAGRGTERTGDFRLLGPLPEHFSERVEARFEDGSDDGSLGVLGVIGPQRMDYGRVIPLVSYCAELVTRKLLA
jgi:heat-inducible transcriptional repressor